PYLARALLVFLIQSASKKRSHLAQHKALPVAFAHCAEIERSLSPRIRGEYPSISRLCQRRLVGVLNREIGQPVTAQSALLPHPALELQKRPRDRSPVEFLDRSLLLV